MIGWIAMLDSQQKIVDHYRMSNSAAVSQATVLRKEQIRVREAILSGITAASSDTRVFVKGILNPVVLAWDVTIYDGTAGIWRGKEYGVSPGTPFEFNWYDINHGTTASRNSFLISSAHANLQSQPYYIWFRYLTEDII